MPKNSKARIGWVLFAMGAGVSCTVALIQGNGAIARGNVILLGILGTVFFFGAAIGLKWHRAPLPLGVPIRVLFLLFCSAALMSVVCWHVWPVNPAPQIAQVSPMPTPPQATTPTATATPEPPTKDETLGVRVVSNLGTPPAGMTGSVQWEPEYTYIRLLLNDPGAVDFDNLDMAVSFDIALAGLDQLTTFPGVTAFPNLPIRPLGGAITATDNSGKKVTIPVYAGKFTSSSSYRIRCDHVPTRGTVEFVAAGVVLNIPNGYSIQEPGKEYGPKRLPTVLNVAGSYKAGTKVVNLPTL